MRVPEDEKVWVLPLHSELTSAEQKKVFERPPDDTTKIVISTNVAETSLTIDDIVYVVDSGFAKEKKFDTETEIDTLATGILSFI